MSHFIPGASEAVRDLREAAALHQLVNTWPGFLDPAPGIILHKQVIPLDNGSYLKDSFRKELLSTTMVTIY